MSSRYRLSPTSVEDMEVIVDYLRERSPLAALRFVEAAQATFEHLAFMPLAYPKLRNQTPALGELLWRPLTGAFNEYLVFYRVVENGRVDVVRVLHGAQDLGRILDDG